MNFSQSRQISLAMFCDNNLLSNLIRLKLNNVLPHFFFSGSGVSSLSSSSCRELEHFTKEEIQQTLLPMQQENRPCNKLPMQVIKESSLLTSLLTYLSPRTNCNLWQATVCYLWHCIPLILAPPPPHTNCDLWQATICYLWHCIPLPPPPTPSEGGPSDFVSSLVYPDGSIQTFHSAFSALIYQEHSFQQICGPFYNVECLLKTLVRWGLITFCSS